MDDFVRCAALLASPATDPALRAQADAWLAAFRLEPAAWAAALGVLRSAGVPPEVRLQAASLLAWKVKRQLGQLQPVERQAELAEALAGLAEAAPAPPPGQARDPAVRCVCVALANLAIQCSGWVRPLDTLGPRLSRERMLEFLTLLPQECEDAAAAAQAASAEVAWGLKARAHKWSPEVAAWLHALHSSSGAAAAASPGAAQGPPSPHQHSPAAAQQREEWEALTLAVLGCFGAWVKWGCLQYVAPHHAAYFASLAGELLFAGDPARGLPFSPTCLPAAVDAASEIIEHATEELQPLLVQLAAALPARAAALAAAGGGAAAEELSHVFSLFVGTHAPLCAASGPQGRALRQGLLQLLALPVEPGGDGGGAALPAMGALSDLLEQLAAARGRHGGGGAWGEGAGEAGDAAGGSLDGADRPMGPQEQACFAASALEVLLAQVAPHAAAFQSPPPAGAGGTAPAQRGTHSPEGVPHALRGEAAAVVDVLGDLLGADVALTALAAHAETAAARHGPASLPAQAALDACLHVLDGMSGLLDTSCAERGAGDPPPGWLAGLLRLYALVPEAGGSSGAPLTILHADLLASWASLGRLVMPLLQASHQHQQQEAVLQLVVGQSLRALSSQHRTADVAPGSTEDVVERGAAALRTLCSSAAACGMPTTPQLLAAVQQGMAALQASPQYQQYQEAHCHLVAGLVHALHGIPPGDRQLQAQAEAAVRQHVLEPLAAALGEAGAALAASPGPQHLQQLRGALWRLHARLRQLQALLNSLESYEEGDGGSLRGAEVSLGVRQAALATLLACWPRLGEVCRWQRQAAAAAAAAPAGASLASVRRELLQEVAHCLSSAMALDPAAFQQALPSFAETAAACCFQPGGGALLRHLQQAVEAYGPLPHLQPPLLGTVRAMLGAPQARALAALRGGDADPEATQALLSLLGCCMRQAAQWRQLAPGAGAEVEAVLSLGLPLAAANAACHHRDASHAALGALTALLALLLDRRSPLHGALLGFARRQGALLVQGLLLALLSLNSASHLPKVVSLMSDMALLAASLAIAQQQQQQQQQGGGAPTAESVCSAAGSQLGCWLGEARAAVTQSGALSEEAMAALLAQWQWQPVLQQAAAQLTQQRGVGGANGGGASMAEVRRGMQRSLRQLADLMRRSGGQYPQQGVPLC